MAEEDITASIEVYLTVENGLEAIAFYEKAFGAKVAYKELTPDGGAPAACDADGIRRPLHAVGLLPRLHHRCRSALRRMRRAALRCRSICRTPLEVDGAIARAVAAGATVTMPASDTFWVMRYGRIRDPYGYVWAFGAPLPLGI